MGFPFTQKKVMERLNKYIVLTIIITCFYSFSNAQTTDSTGKEWSVFRIGLNYNSNLNYFGRTDSLRSSGFFPMAEVWFTPGLYINAAPIFINNPLQRFEYAGTIVTAGYQFNANDKWTGNVYALKPLYKESMELVQASLKAQTGALLTYLNPVVNINVGGDLKFGEQTDIGATAGIDHIIRFPVKEGIVLAADPSAYVYAGTQQFSKTHYKKNNFLFLPGNEERITETSSRFNILAYEFSVPVIFATKKLELVATPSYIIPKNLIEVNDQPELSEQGKETLYITLGAKVNF